MERFDKRVLSGTSGFFAQPTTVRFQDVDAAGIGFFAEIAAYFHDAWFAWLGVRGIDMAREIVSAPWLLPMVHSECDYLGPIRFGDRLSAEIVVLHAEGSEVAVGFRLVRPETGEVVAVGQQQHVCVDRESFRRRELPEAFRQACEGLADEP